MNITYIARQVNITDDMKKLVEKHPDSFVIVSHVDDVLGNFKRLDSSGKPEVSLLDQGDGTGI